MKLPAIPLLLSLFVSSSLLHAETVKDREGAVRKDKETMENDARWIFNDVALGMEKAKQSGKPLLVVLRCVPCKACMGIDAAILSEKSLDPLLDQFVCVRLINANALDLTQFQFDYDLSFSTMFFNGDGTVYGRYGSWSHHKDPYNSTLTGYQRALEAVLAIHKGYPANKAALAGKQGVELPFRTPTEIPTLAGKYQRELDWNGQVVASCVHCHMIGDAIRSSYRDKGKPVPIEWVHPMPVPETVGLVMAPDQPAHVEDVLEGSAAAQSGLKKGDDMVSLAGQPLISATDVSWVLHRSPDQAAIPVVVRRGGAETPLTLSLPSGWRLKTNSAGRVGSWSMRGMVTGGMVLEDLADDERAKLGLKASELALLVKSVGQYGKHAAAKKAGFEKNDVIVEIGGMKNRMSEGEIFARLLQEQMPGKTVATTVMRGGKSVDLKLPMQ